MTEIPPPSDPWHPPGGDEGSGGGRQPPPAPGAPTPPPPPPPPPPSWEQPPPPPPPPPGYGAPGQYGAPPYQAYPTFAAGPVDPYGRPLAEWWKRVVAYLIDGVVIGVPGGIIFAIVIFSAGASSSTDPVTGQVTPTGAGIGAILFGYALLFVAIFAYFTIMNGGSRGQTVGKMALRIQVRDSTTGGPIGYGKAFLRYLVQWGLGVVTCGLGGLLDVLWPLWDQQRQAVHDKAASSVVIDLG